MAAREDREPAELNISADTVGFIIATARRFDLGEEGGESDDDIGAVSLDEEGEAETGEGNPVADELREAIDDLNDDELIDLIALAWVGRGDFGPDEWAEARALARERHRRQSADYLMGMPTLGDFLEEGLTALGHSYEPP